MAPKNKRNSTTSIDDNLTLSLMDKFIKTLIDVSVCNDIQELKNHTILECVWKEMEKQLNLSVDTLKKIWYLKLHMQLFCPHPIYLIDTKIKLIEYIYEKGIANARDVNWHNMVLCFDGMTKQFLTRIFRSLLETAKAKMESMAYEDLITYLYSHYIPYLIKYSEDKILPRLRYDNDKLVHNEMDLQEKDAYTVQFNNSYEYDKE